MSSSRIDLAVSLAEHGANFPSDAVDRHTADRLAANLLDVLAVTLGGVDAEGLGAVRSFLRDTSAVGAAVVVGTADRLAAPAAAFANATAAHALEFDDALDDGGGMHAGPSVHAAALAVADSIGGVSGVEYVAATAVGLDVAVRLALAPTEDFGWHRASVFSVFGATVAASRILRLDAERTRSALGLALSQSSGTRQALTDGASGNRVHTGLAARNAVTAVYLAAAGIGGAQDVFEGANGFFPLYQRNAYDRDVVLEGLGSVLLSSRISEKPYPGGRFAHAFIEAALSLRTELGTGAAIEAVRAHLPPALVRAGGGSAPFPTGWRATYSFRYAVALALVTGAAPIRAFVEPESVDPRVRDVFDRIAIVEDLAGRPRGLLEVVGAASTVRREIGIAKGSPHDPLSRDELLAKFWNCFDFAGGPIPRPAAQRVIELVGVLSTLDSTSQITGLLGA
jgi:2-methylcitrate dehydratase PrpD